MKWALAHFILVANLQGCCPQSADWAHRGSEGSPDSMILQPSESGADPRLPSPRPSLSLFPEPFPTPRVSVFLIHPGRWGQVWEEGSPEGGGWAGGRSSFFRDEKEPGCVSVCVSHMSLGNEIMMKTCIKIWTVLYCIIMICIICISYLKYLQISVSIYNSNKAFRRKKKHLLLLLEAEI